MELIIVAASIGFILAGTVFGYTPAARRMTGADILNDHTTKERNHHE